MVKKKSIAIRIQRDGTVEIDVLNAQGSECLKWTSELEGAFGSADSQRTLKAQFYQEQSASQSIHHEES